MFIGHFAIAFILWYLFPGIPLWVLLTSVSFPDLLWPILILLGREKLLMNPKSPFQKDLIFKSYPYSHSLLLSSLLYLIPASILAVILRDLMIIPVFLTGTMSHWFLDYLTHMHDLPLKGFGKDLKIGLGGWSYGPFAFFFELIFYIAVTVIFVPDKFLFGALELGIIFHVANSNSFFGFIKKNIFLNEKIYAIIVMVGYLLFIVLSSVLALYAVP